MADASLPPFGPPSPNQSAAPTDAELLQQKAKEALDAQRAADAVRQRDVAAKLREHAGFLPGAGPAEMLGLDPNGLKGLAKGAFAPQQAVGNAIIGAGKNIHQFVDPSAGKPLMQAPPEGGTGTGTRMSEEQLAAEKAPEAGGGGSGAPVDYKAMAQKALGLPRSPEVQAEMDAAQANQNEALGTAGEHGAMAAMQQAGYARQYQHEQEKNQADMMAQRERQKQVEQNLLSRWDEMSAAVRSEEIDPNRVWNNKSTMAKITATVGIALGGALNAKTGHGNPALDALDREVNNDIQAQVVNMHNKAGRLNDMSQIYPMLVQSGLSDQAAQAGARMVGRDIFVTKLQAAAATAQSREVRDRLALTLADLQKRQAADKAAMEQAVNQMAFRMQFGGKGGAVSEQHTAAFAESLQKDKIPDAMAALAHADENLDSFGTGNDVPGIGLIPDYMPGPLIKLFYGNEGVANQQSWQGIKNDIMHAKSGVAVSPTELDRLRRELDGAHDADSVRRVVARERGLVEKLYQNRLAGSPKAGAQYEKQGGLPQVKRGEPVK